MTTLPQSIHFPLRTSRRFKCVSYAFAVNCMMQAASATAGQATFEGLGFLDPDGFGPVIAYGVSANGQIVVGEGVSEIGFEAFQWTASTGIQGIGAFNNPGGFQSSIARACSADGSVIVGSSSLPDSLNEDGSPFRWTEKTGLVFLGNLNGNSSGGVARGVSTDGNVVVGYVSSSNGLEAFRWTQETGMVGLSDLPGGAFNSQAAAVSGDGTVIVGLASTSASPYNRSFKWREDTGIVEIVPSTYRAIGISRDGHFAAGGNLGRASRLDLLTGAVLQVPHVAIPGLTTDSDTAWAANADGSVIVGMQNLSQLNGFFGRAFMWDATHGTRIVRNVLINDYGLGSELAGWELNNATTVSDNGRVLAGYGFAPSGEQAGWRVTFPSPCPPDINDSGSIDVDDLLTVINAWGACESIDCPADITDNGLVDVDDLLAVINAWGPCSG